MNRQLSMQINVLAWDRHIHVACLNIPGFLPFNVDCILFTLTFAVRIADNEFWCLVPYSPTYIHIVKVGFIEI